MRIAAFLLVLLTLGACETVQGAGQDIGTAGDAITDASEDVQNDM